VNDEDSAVVDDAVIAVREALSGHNIMATRIVILAETIEPNGDVALWTATDEDVKAWHTLGMLYCAIQREQAGMITGED
jgi:hypothetical protein